MKKILFTVTLIMMMAFSGLCFAADGNDLNKEQKVAESFIEVFQKDTAPEYVVISKNFSDELKTKVNERAYKKLQTEVKDKFGTIKDVKFYTYQRFDQSDRVTYVASFDKETLVAIIFEFNKDGKLTGYTLSPLQVKNNSK